MDISCIGGGSGVRLLLLLLLLLQMGCSLIFSPRFGMTRGARVMESGRIGASLGMHHLPAKRVQNGARMAKDASPPRIFSHSLTFYDICTCCAWLGLEMGPASGRKC